MSPQEAPTGRRVGRQPPSVLQMKVEPRPICLKFSSMSRGYKACLGHWAPMAVSLITRDCNTQKPLILEFQQNVEPDSETEEGKVKRTRTNAH